MGQNCIHLKYIQIYENYLCLVKIFDYILSNECSFWKTCFESIINQQYRSLSNKGVELIKWNKIKIIQGTVIATLLI